MIDREECEQTEIDDEGDLHYCYLRPGHRGDHEAKCWCWSRRWNDECEPEFIPGWIASGARVTAPWSTVAHAPWLG